MRKSRNLSDEHKQKISDALRGENNPNYGKILSVTHRSKISNGLKKYWSKVEGLTRVLILFSRNVSYII